MQTMTHQIRCFDGFTLDLTRGCLLRGAEEVKLPPKPFEALKYLVENPGRLISKTELIEVIWPDTAVTDDSLVQCMIEVRRALRDDAQQTIKTVPRRGYIFEKPVTSGPTAVTTITEEKGVQLIIEEGEEMNGHSIAQAQTLPAAGVLALPAYQPALFQRLAATIKHHRVLAATIGLLAFAAAFAGIFALTRPSEAIDSVAVMPFVNVNGDPNAEYLAEGISDNVIDRLSHVPDLKKVIALNSVLRYKGKQTDPQTVGRELGVRAVLIGRVTQHGDDVSITTELVDVRDNKHLWGEQYNRKLADIMAVQTQIAQEITENLRLRLNGDQKQRLAKNYTQSGEAYQLYMMGRYYFHNRRSKEGLEKSVNYFEQAIKKDASYAPAYAGLGDCYHVLGWRSFMPPKESRQKEEWAALRALQIDDALPEAHVLMAHIKEFDCDWSGAAEAYKRALELDPNSARAHQTYGWHLQSFGRFDEAMAHLKRAQELDPFSVEINLDMGTLFNFMHQYDQALRQFQQGIDMDPNYTQAYVRMVPAYQGKGMHQEAVEQLKKHNVSGGQLGYAYAVAGMTDEARKVLNEMTELSKQSYVSPFDFALVYMGLGDKDHAFEWLNKTYDEYPYRMSFINVNPRFDSLRSDPRFDALLRRMKLVS